MLQNAPSDLECNRLYHQLLITTQAKKNMLRHGPHFIAILLEQGLGAEAAKVYLNGYNLTKRLDPGPAPIKHKLAGFLDRHGHSKEAVLLLKNLHKEQPPYPQLPEACLLAAQILSEKLGRDKQALSLLNFIQKKHPNNSSHEEIDCKR